jgi:hypothetical protein
MSFSTQLINNNNITNNNNNNINIGGNIRAIGKYVVFDVDETLGYFSQLGAFMDALSFYYKDFSRSHFEKFNEILDLYPEFIRTNIIDILKYINNKKSQGTCSGIFIYTNNQGPRTWVQHIAKYFEYKVGGQGQLFEKIIAAYKVNGKVVEQGRTSQNKMYADLLRITGISPQAEVCFVDDLNHPGMRHSNVLYLNVKPYVKTLSVNEMIRRYLDSGVIPSHNINRFTDTMNERLGNINNKNNNNNPVENMKINLHECNYISLNTPSPSPDNVSKENKDTNEKLFNYIKLFLKNKQYSKKGMKNNSRNDSRTRRHYRAKHQLNVQVKTRKYKKSNRNSDSTLHNKKKTRRVGRFMRI